MQSFSQLLAIDEKHYQNIAKLIQTYKICGQIWQRHAKLCPDMANQWYVCLDFAKLSKVLSIFQSIRPVMAKLYKVMTRYDQFIQIYTSYGQTWQTSTKL